MTNQTCLREVHPQYYAQCRLPSSYCKVTCAVLVALARATGMATGHGPHGGASPIARRQERRAPAPQAANQYEYRLYRARAVTTVSADFITNYNPSHTVTPRPRPDLCDTILRNAIAD